MSKNVNLIIGILATIVFIGYLSDSEPVEIFGFTVSIWFFRIIWLFVAIVNLINYLRKRKLQK